jgi:hypothetical protein
MAARRKGVMGSWDGFIVPWPFTRVVFAYGHPVTVPREMDAAAVDRCRAQVEAAIEGAMKRAEAALEEEDLWRA